MSTNSLRENVFNKIVNRKGFPLLKEDRYNNMTATRTSRVFLLESKAKGDEPC